MENDVWLALLGDYYAQKRVTGDRIMLPFTIDELETFKSPSDWMEGI